MNHVCFYIMGGFGHIKPAQALVEQFEKQKIKSQKYDIFSPDGQPNYDSSNFYNFITKSPLLLPFWNLITRHDLIPAWVFHPVHGMEIITGQKTIHKLRNFGSQYPELIVTATHFSAGLLASKAFPNKKIFLYVTDIHPHGLWKIDSPNVHYLVPMEETKIDINRHGIKNEHISICSFPIHQEILEDNQIRFNRRLKKFSSTKPNKIEILIMSGGAGTGFNEMNSLIKQLSPQVVKDRVCLTFLVSTPNLVKQVLASLTQYQTHGHNVTVEVYTPKSLYPALNKADILITKAGGDITFEALAEGLPIYTLKDVGDHERLNRQYLELIGASRPLFLCQKPWELIESDITSGDIIKIIQSSHEHGAFHRDTNIVSTIQSLIASSR